MLVINTLPSFTLENVLKMVKIFRITNLTYIGFQMKKYINMHIRSQLIKLKTNLTL